MGGELDEFGKLLEDFNKQICGVIDSKKELRRGTEVEEQPTVGRPNPESEKLRKNQWSIIGSGRYLASSLTVKTLPSSAYSFVDTNLGIVFRDNTVNSDNLIDFPNSLYSEIVEEVDKFWGIGGGFEEFGFLHRRGYLFYGPAGSGKSCLVQQISRNVVEKGGVVFIIGHHPRMASDALKLFREVEPDRKIVCVFEDIDSIIREWGDAEVLMLLDGENQVDKVINVATTNYPEVLDKRIVARPRRFDRIVKIDMPNRETREIYFRNKLKINGEDVRKWADSSEGFSFAALSELVISVKCLGNSFEDSVRRMKDISIKKSSKEFEQTNVGF